MVEEVYLTEEGAEKLRMELEELITKKRPELARRLREAKEMGDLSENADYIDAKEQQGFLEGRIRYIEHVLRTATIVSEGELSSDVVRIGSTVTIQTPGESPETYTIVGAAEASPRDGRISHESPLGAALLGARVGQKITYHAPLGTMKYRVLEIHQ